jgi:two-component sensor histidine kinase
MFIWWGDDLIQFYNDAYRQTMGPAMHPMALGARGRESWADIWPIIGPQVELVMSGKGATWNVEQLVPINRQGKPENVWWTYGYSPIDLEGHVGGVLVVCNDVTEQHLRTEAYRDETRRLAQQFEQAPGFITMLAGPEHVFQFANAAYRRLVGSRDLVGKTVREGIPEAASQGFVELLDRVYQTGEPFVGRRTPIMLESEQDKPARQHYLDFIYQAVREPDGSISGIFVEGQDVTDHVLAEQRLELVNRELQHRVKNTLATVQAIAMQTLRDVTDKGPVEALTQRILALSRAHDSLIQQNWSSADIREAAQSSFDNFGVSDRVDIEGPSLELGPNATLSLAMILHELSTNAMKYGALSVETGRVSLRWDIENTGPEAELVVRWTEQGGPPAVAPTGRSGFGTKLVKMGLDGTGQVKLDFLSAGLSAELRAPVASLHRS